MTNLGWLADIPLQCSGIKGGNAYKLGLFRSPARWDDCTCCPKVLSFGNGRKIEGGLLWLP